MANDSDTQEAGKGATRFHVTVQRQVVDRFSKVITRHPHDQPSNLLRVPLTFPATWYGLGEVQSSIMASVASSLRPEKSALLHLEQTIESPGQLEVDKTYILDIQVGALDKDGKFRVSAKVSDLQDVPLVFMTSLFVVVGFEEKQP